MTLTAPLPLRAAAAALAALLLATALAVAMPARATLPGVLDALGVTAADAHTQQHCYDETRYVTFGGKTATYTHTTCVNIAHNHSSWWARAVHWGATTTLCGTFSVAVGGATAGAGAAAAALACGATFAILPGP
ncbi:hypothetical protein [Candidatus Poriferisodalis sp.]|uniref:hypothetical protein n=1 Tax=Candidatus Poriferisodalis sp. TaxID=3101277 RepID=UPI003B02C41C